jgi:hypothetical protein
MIGNRKCEMRKKAGMIRLDKETIIELLIVTMIITKLHKITGVLETNSNNK